MVMRKKRMKTKTSRQAKRHKPSLLFTSQTISTFIIRKLNFFILIIIFIIFIIVIIIIIFIIFIIFIICYPCSSILPLLSMFIHFHQSQRLSWSSVSLITRVISVNSTKCKIQENLEKGNSFEKNQTNLITVRDKKSEQVSNMEL